MLEEERRILISLSLEKSDEKFRMAKDIFKSFPNGAVSSAYYSMFHVVHALFLEYEIAMRKKRGHRSMTALFSEKFVHTGIFPAEYSKFLGQMEADRNIGDYDIEKNFTVEEAGKAIEKAEIFNREVRKLIQEHQEKL